MDKKLDNERLQLQRTAGRWVRSWLVTCSQILGTETARNAGSYRDQLRIQRIPIADTKTLTYLNLKIQRNAGNAALAAKELAGDNFPENRVSLHERRHLFPASDQGLTTTAIPMSIGGRPATFWRADCLERAASAGHALACEEGNDQQRNGSAVGMRREFKSTGLDRA